MTAPTESTILPVPEELSELHAAALAGFSQPGGVLTGATRRAVVEESRAARSCGYCRDRAESVSPGAFEGAHATVTDLPTPLVELAHRLTTDPGRLTRAWFRSVIDSGLSEAEYVEAAGLIGTSTIADTFATALEGAPRPLAAARDGAPSGDTNEQPADVDAYVPLMSFDHPHPRFSRQAGDRPLPNICRALGMVPAAVDEFWALFSPHYMPWSTQPEDQFGRSQIEFVASRTSALNECFY